MLPPDFLGYLVRHILSVYWGWFKLYLPYILPWVIMLAIFVIGGVILQILMMRAGGRHNRLSPSFNSLVGSLTYGLMFALILTGAYLVWGSQVIDESVFAVIGLVSFILAGVFLRFIGFWYY